MVGRSIPGRGIAVRLTRGLSLYGHLGFELGFAPPGRSFYIDHTDLYGFSTGKIFYQPALLEPVTRSHVGALPLSGQLPISTITLVVANASWWITDYLVESGPIMSTPGRLEGALVRLYRESEGTFDPTTDLIWQGRVQRQSAVDANSEQVTLSCIDLLGWYLDGKQLGGETLLNEDDHEDLKTHHSEVFAAFEGKAVPVLFASTSASDDFAGPAIPIEESGGVWTFQYEDTLDADGNVMKVPEGLDQVVCVNKETNADVTVALQDGIFLNVGTFSQGGGLKNAGKFTVTQTYMDGLVTPATFDPVKHLLYVKLPTSARSNDATLEAAFGTYSGEDDFHLRTHRTIGALLRLLVEHGEIPPSLISLDGLETLSIALHEAGHKIHAKLTSGEDLQTCVQEVSQEVGLAVRMGNAGLIEIVPEEVIPTGEPIYTIDPRQQIAEPEIQLGQWGDRFTAATGRTEIGYLYDEAGQAGVKHVRKVADAAAKALNGGKTIRKEIVFRWLRGNAAMRDAVESYVEAQGYASDLVRVQAAAPTVRTLVDDPTGAFWTAPFMLNYDGHDYAVVPGEGEPGYIVSQLEIPYGGHVGTARFALEDVGGLLTFDCALMHWLDGGIVTGYSLFLIDSRIMTEAGCARTCAGLDAFMTSIGAPDHAVDNYKQGLFVGNGPGVDYTYTGVASGWENPGAVESDNLYPLTFPPAIEYEPVGQHYETALDLALLNLMPGDVISYYHLGTASPGHPEVNDIGAPGDIWRIMAAEPNETDQTSSLLLWRLHEPYEGIEGGS